MVEAKEKAQRENSYIVILSSSTYHRPGRLDTRIRAFCQLSSHNEGNGSEVKAIEAENSLTIRLPYTS
jgi:hypothetical protein